MQNSNAVSTTVPYDDKGLWGHPRGLMTLYFTEMWERLSYYGMRAILILFMVAPVTTGGLGMDVPKAAAIYGWYTAMVYLMGIPGGWVADQLIGQRKAVLIGGVLIMLGHFSLAVPSLQFFYLGLVLIVLGTGLLKPNVSTMVGSLYAEGDVRRDSGFSIFYQGINVGAFLAPFVCGTLGQRVGWHWGFGAAGVGMLFGLIQFVAGSHKFGDIGKAPTKTAGTVGISSISPQFVVSAVIWVVGLFFFPSTLKALAHGLLFDLWLFLGPLVIIMMSVLPQCDGTEKKRLLSISFFFFFIALFWAAFEQAGSSLNLFADQNTKNAILGWDFPSSWHQSSNPIFIVIFAPIVAWLWIRLGKKNPSTPIKFTIALSLVGLGFAVLAWAAQLSGSEKSLVSPFWLVLCYLLHTLGELCLAPVGMSTYTKLAPTRYVGLMMGVYFLSLACGNKLGGWVAGFFETFPLPKLFGTVFLTTTCGAILLLLLVKPIRKLMSGVH